MKPTRFQFHMKPEWNRSQRVIVNDRTLTVSAAPFDVPSAFQVETTGSQVIVKCLYEFSSNEPVELALQSERARIFRGQSSGRLMSFVIEAEGLADASSALRELQKDLKQYADEREKEPVRDSVHIGMFRQALPEMGSLIEQKLQEMRAFAF